MFAVIGDQGTQALDLGTQALDLDLNTRVLISRLIASLVIGFIVAGVHGLTKSANYNSMLPSTLAMLCVLIALVTIVIGNSLARAFGLVGALSIVRFRTVVEDTRDTAFVIYAVACGMACGAGYIIPPLVVTPLIVITAYVFRPRAVTASTGEQRLMLRLAMVPQIEQRIQEVLPKRVKGYRLVGIATARGGAALEMTYMIAPLPPNESLALVTELNRVEGVQSVEIKD